MSKQGASQPSWPSSASLSQVCLSLTAFPTAYKMNQMGQQIQSDFNCMDHGHAINNQQSYLHDFPQHRQQSQQRLPEQLPQQHLYNYSKSRNPEVRQLTNRMRMGTGVNQLLQAEDAPTHQLDSLERFKKDFAAYDRQQRDRELARRQLDIENRRLQYLQRENQRWEKAEEIFTSRRDRDLKKAESQVLGQKKTHNSNGLAFNPINLSYDENSEGRLLKQRDEDREIRRFVRARNMDDRGNGSYDLLSGKPRKGIEQVVPEELTERFSSKLKEHYDGLKITVPKLQLLQSPRAYHL